LIDQTIDLPCIKSVSACADNWFKDLFAKRFDREGHNEE